VKKLATTINDGGVIEDDVGLVASTGDGSTR